MLPLSGRRVAEAAEPNHLDRFRFDIYFRWAQLVIAAAVAAIVAHWC